MKRRGFFGQVAEQERTPPAPPPTSPAPVIANVPPAQQPQRSPAAPPATSETQPVGGATPGLVSAHHRLYAAIARGLPAPRSTPKNFTDLLKNVIWPIENALDSPMIEAAARLGALEALEAGCTTVIDHHASPRSIEGSLSLIARACAEVGVRVVCSYAASDLRGADRARLGLEESRRFVELGGRGMVGLDASMTASPETIDLAIGMANELGVGVHAKVAEGIADSGGGADLVRRSKESWVLAHGVHLPDGLEIAGTIAHCPRSNMDRGVGYGMPSRFGQRVALGTDGYGGDLLEEFRLAYARLREINVGTSPRQPWSWLEAGWLLVPEARQDRVHWSLREIEPEYLVANTGIRPLTVVVGGKTVLSGGQPTLVDATEIRTKAAEQTRRLVSRL
ncbi:MAG: amidohydrolase family protein [Acidimicrobiales bacterium]|nr:amidohydrolase family protein [Acidimicrobiales bacterium]